jgi:hypothetical protein
MPAVGPRAASNSSGGNEIAGDAADRGVAIRSLSRA